MASEEVPEGGQALHGLPLYIALVDGTGTGDWMELVKTGLLAAVEALPPYSLFALAVFTADKVGLFDMRRDVPSLLQAYVDPSRGEVEVALADTLPLSDFLVPIGEFKENISIAVESLTALVPVEGREQPEKYRAFGPATAAFLDYLGSFEGGFASCRVMAFLAGPPVLPEGSGVGSVDPGRLIKLVGRDAELLLPSTSFYREEAERAVKAGVCIDLFVISNLYADLASLKFLSTKTGGKLMLYESAVNCTLPQDMYRFLSRPQAAQGLLRLRTSTEIKPAIYYGNLFADPTYSNLYHVVGCDDFYSVAVDFEFEDSSGFTLGGGNGPVIQLAFAYTTCVAGGAEGDRPVVRRKLRICNVRVDTSLHVKEVYRSANPDVIMSLMAHKIFRASLDEGVAEARLLLQDWLCILLAKFNEATKADRHRGEITLSFVGYDGLFHLQRYVYGLLKHNVLASENVHPDERIFLQSFFGSLQPHFLLNAIYPTLSSYTDESTPAEPICFLSRETLEASHAPIFLMDAFTAIHVHCKDPHLLPWPPSQQSILRNRVQELKTSRHITPLVTFSKTGEPAARHVMAGLIEDLPGDSLTYYHFLERVKLDLERFMSKV